MEHDGIIGELESRIRVLEVKSAAREAMFRYWRVLDYKIFDELKDCFTENCDYNSGTGNWRAVGRQEIYEFLYENEGKNSIRLSHFGHNDEITVIDDRTAKGVFKLEDWVVMDGRTIQKGFGQYNILFEKGDDGVFRIADFKLLHDHREEYRVFVDGNVIETTPAMNV